VNPWPFIVAAYAIAIAAVTGLGLWSFIRMRSAEREVEAFRSAASIRQDVGPST